jgi:regulator of RNase E activity RraA
MLDETLLTLLKTVDTPTVCDAIEIAHGKRGFAGYTRGAVFATAPQAPAMVGFACTAKIAAHHPPSEDERMIREKRLAYYRHVASAPKPSIMVVEDIDHPDRVGAFWGRVNASIHRGFGISGVLTNGLVRNVNDLPEDFPILAAATSPSHAFAHVTGFGVPVEVFGLSVRQGDIVYADRHGAAVIPADIIGRLADAIRNMLAAEKIVLDAARSDDFDLARFEAAWAQFEKARPAR